MAPVSCRKLHFSLESKECKHGLGVASYFQEHPTICLRCADVVQEMGAGHSGKHRLQYLSSECVHCALRARCSLGLVLHVGTTTARHDAHDAHHVIDFTGFVCRILHGTSLL